MNISLLIDLQKEIKRLTLAGCELAIDDFSLKKLLPQIKKLGDGSPVILKIAQALEKLITSKPNEAFDNFIELSKVLNAILYIQCETEIKGELNAVECTPIDGSIYLPYSQLKAITKALSARSSQDRYEIIQQGYEDGVFKDIRLIKAVIKAMDASNFEKGLNPFSLDVGSFIYNNILSKYGESILPLLVNTLNIKGKKSQAYKLQLINMYGGDKYKELYLNALYNGSMEIKLPAIRALTSCISVEEIKDVLIDICKSKNAADNLKQVAYSALAKDTSLATSKLFISAFNDDLYLVIDAIRANPSPKLSEFLVGKGTELLKTLAMEDPPYEAIRKFSAIIYCMEGKTDSNIIDFLKNSLTSKSYLTKLALDTRVKEMAGYYKVGSFAKAIAYILLKLGSDELHKFVASLKDLNNNHLIEYAFEAAVKSQSAEELYINYNDYIRNSKKTFAGRQVLDRMYRLAVFNEKITMIFLDISKVIHYPYESSYIGKPPKNTWDKRWLDILIDLDEADLACRFASKDNKNCIQYMLDKLGKEPSLTKQRTIHMLLGLAQAEYSDLNNLIANILYNTDTTNIRIDHYTYSYIDILKLLPAAYIKNIEEAAAKNVHKFVNAKLRQIIDCIKTKNI